VARAALGTPTPAASVPAAIVFCAILLVALAAARAPMGDRPTWPGAAVGLAGGTALVLASFAGVPAVTAGLRTAPSTLLWWLPLVALVAASEELVLRGALFTALEGSHGDVVAVAVTAALFAVIHLPLYGLGAMPIDLAVGVLLGGLRVVSEGVTAPLLAHVLADVATAWLP
jgi:membrane protease YdiL (CAAX protease family)